ncbi:MAG: hypothetical protein KIT09_33890 [Bryobacteraceae bacterium]|nr:hypothetical protein [Bryobacteraceae bacterium]
MRVLAIAVIPGDGIGPDVVRAARRVLACAGEKHRLRFEFKEFDWGAEHFFAHGKMMPPNALELLQPFDAILLGMGRISSCAAVPNRLPADRRSARRLPSPHNRGLELLFLTVSK